MKNKHDKAKTHHNKSGKKNIQLLVDDIKKEHAQMLLSSICQHQTPIIGNDEHYFIVLIHPKSGCILNPGVQESRCLKNAEILDQLVSVKIKYRHLIQEGMALKQGQSITIDPERLKFQFEDDHQLAFLATKNLGTLCKFLHIQRLKDLKSHSGQLVVMRTS